MTAEQAAQRGGFAAQSELALRNAMEDLLRQRYPNARMCHEMVMGAGQVRADLCCGAMNWQRPASERGASHHHPDQSELR